jgi:hypothetical protein
MKEDNESKRDFEGESNEYLTWTSSFTFQSTLFWFALVLVHDGNASQRVLLLGRPLLLPLLLRHPKTAVFFFSVSVTWYVSAIIISLLRSCWFSLFQ